MRWETANADGKNAAFDSAIPGPKFEAPDKAAAVSRALPLVAAAYRSGPLSSPASSCFVVTHLCSALNLVCPFLFCRSFSSVLLCSVMSHYVHSPCALHLQQQLAKRCC